MSKLLNLKEAEVVSSVKNVELKRTPVVLDPDSFEPRVGLAIKVVWNPELVQDATSLWGPEKAEKKLVDDICQQVTNAIRLSCLYRPSASEGPLTVEIQGNTVKVGDLMVKGSDSTELYLSGKKIWPSNETA